MKSKPLSRMVPDIKRTLSQSTKNVAYNITKDLKEWGPYWTGQFEGAWEVNVGQNGIPASIKDASTINSNGAIEYQGKEYREPGDKEITEPFIPPPQGLKGYTIGNLMEYRDEAMDLKPGVRTDNFTRLTAREDWFVSYTKGNPMQETLANSVDEVFWLEGFR